MSLKTDDQDSLTALAGSLESAVVDETSHDTTTVDVITLHGNEADRRQSYADLGDTSPEKSRLRDILGKPSEDSLNTRNSAWRANNAGDSAWQRANTGDSNWQANTSGNNSTSNSPDRSPARSNRVAPVTDPDPARSPQGEPHSPVSPQIFVSQEKIKDKDKSPTKKAPQSDKHQVGFFIGDIPAVDSSHTYVGYRHSVNILCRFSKFFQSANIATFASRTSLAVLI